MIRIEEHNSAANRFYNNLKQTHETNFLSYARPVVDNWKKVEEIRKFDEKMGIVSKPSKFIKEVEERNKAEWESYETRNTVAWSEPKTESKPVIEHFTTTEISKSRNEIYREHHEMRMKEFERKVQQKLNNYPGIHTLPPCEIEKVRLKWKVKCEIKNFAKCIEGLFRLTRKN